MYVPSGNVSAFEGRLVFQAYLYTYVTYVRNTVVGMEIQMLCKPVAVRAWTPCLWFSVDRLSAPPDKWDATFMRREGEACLDWLWHRDICSVCVLRACWIGGRIGVDGSRIGGKKAIGWRPLGQSLKPVKCHGFTVTGIARGNWDYERQEITCVLANTE